MQGRIRWLFLPNEPQTERDETGHGTCVTSKVTSTTYGVAKNANIVLMMIYPIDDYIAVSRYIEALAIIARDIESKGLQGKVVICSTLNGEQPRS
jgi:subtilisin family serine protease